jgi:hypothetical protein
MTDNERIDKFLDAIAKSKDGRLNIQKFLIEDLKDDDVLSFQRIILDIKRKGFVEQLSGLGTTCLILSAGLDIVNSGGYIKYLERQKAAEEEEVKLGKIKAELDESNLKHVRFILKYKWLPFILSGVAIIVSIIAIIISIVKS